MVRTPWGLERTRRLLESRASGLLDGELKVRELHGSVFGDIELRGVTITRLGEPAIAADAIRVRYKLLDLIRGRLVLDEVVLTRPTIVAVEGADGWNLARLAKARPPRAPNATAQTFLLRHVSLSNGALTIRPRTGDVRQLDQFSTEARLAYDGKRWTIDVDRASAIDVTTGVELRDLQTTMTFGEGRTTFDRLTLTTSRSRVTGHVRTEYAESRRTWDVSVAAEPFSVDELAKYFPRVPTAPDVRTFTFNASGPMDGLQGTWAFTSNAGNTSGRFRTAGASEITRITGDARMSNLNLAPWLGKPDLESRLTGQGTFDFTELRGDAAPAVAFTFDGANAMVAGYEARRIATRGTYRGGVVNATALGDAYGAAWQAETRWHVGTRDFAAKGRFDRLNVRDLPPVFQAPQLQSHAAGLYDFHLYERGWTADVTFDPSTVEGADIAAGTTAFIDARGDQIVYRARGEARALDPLRFAQVWPELPRVLESWGGHVNTTFDLDGRGGSLDTATFRGTFHLVDTVASELRTPALDVGVTLDRRRLALDVRGRVEGIAGPRIGLPEQEGFRAAANTGVHLVFADVSAPLTVDNVDGRGTVDLDEVRYRGLKFDAVKFAGALAAGTAEVERLEITGKGLAATASGRLALSGEEQSDLTYCIDAADLAALGSLTSQPLTGTVRAEGRITGPAMRLTAAGTLRGHDVTVGRVNVLALDSKFTAELPDQRFDALVADVTGKASFVDVAGTRIDQVASTIKYRAGTIDVDATLDQRTRSLQVAGSVIPHPDHHEVHLSRLALSAGPSAQWSLPPGREAVVQYGNNLLRIEGLDLAHGDALVRISGAIGESARADTSLAIRGERVQIEDINQLLLGTHTMTGQLDAAIEVTGSLNEPRAAGTVTVGAGTVDGVAFDEVVAKIGYLAHRLELDARLEAGASGRLTAVGSVPIGASGAEAPRYGLRLESTGINLGLFQPFIGGLTDVTGTGVFNVNLAGPADSPDFTGTVAIRSGAFTVPYTGMAYRNLNAAFAVKGRELTVEAFTVEDEDRHVLTVRGGFNVPGDTRESSFNLYISGEGVHVLKNHLGDVGVTLDLHAYGDVKTPLLNGTINVDHATVEVDDVLDQLRSTGYVPMPNEVVTDETLRDTLAPGPLEGGSYSITLALNDNVVLRGRDLRTGNGPIGLGAINITVGGALIIAKDIGELSTIRGRLDVVRGHYEFQSRLFTIQRGSELVFRGGTVLDPQLNVTAERQISGVIARVRVTGTARQPEVTLSSTPSLDQSDILSLIIFNEPTNELLSTQKVALAARAGTLAARAIATPLADSVARALNLDLFEIRPSDDTRGGATVSIGQQVNDRLFVGFRQDFGPSEISQVEFDTG